jgi:hypothetical protein
MTDAVEVKLQMLTNIFTNTILPTKLALLIKQEVIRTESHVLMTLNAEIAILQPENVSSLVLIMFMVLKNMDLLKENKP